MCNQTTTSSRGCKPPLPSNAPYIKVIYALGMTELVSQDTSIDSATPSLPHYNNTASLDQPFLCKAARALLSLKNTVETQWRQDGWSSLVGFRTRFSMVHVLLRWFWILGKNPTVQTPSLTFFFGLSHIYVEDSEKLSENESFTSDSVQTELMWLQGSMFLKTSLKTLCSPWTLVKFVASLDK